MSIKLEDFKLTQFLIKNNADIYARNNSNQTIIEYTMFGRNSRIIDLVLSNKNKTVENTLYQNLLFEKTKQCHKRLALHALKRGALFNKVDENKMIPFVYKKNRNQIFRYFFYRQLIEHRRKTV